MLQPDMQKNQLPYNRHPWTTTFTVALFNTAKMWCGVCDLDMVPTGAWMDEENVVLTCSGYDMILLYHKEHHVINRWNGR